MMEILRVLVPWGSYPETFNFNTHRPPLYSFESAVATVVFYLSVLKLLTMYMKNAKPYSLKAFSFVHNFFLFALSFVMSAGIIYELFQSYEKHQSMHVLLCDSKKQMISGRLQWWIYVFYLSKVYEFLDTYLQVLKKRELSFLHVYHHCITFLLVWSTMRQQMSIQWVSFLVNAMVHVIMYFYYWQVSMGFRPWWKQLVTVVQIFQFVSTLFVNMYWAYGYYQGWGCSGSLWCWTFGEAVIVSFIVLFSNFYCRSYKRGVKQE